MSEQTTLDRIRKIRTRVRLWMFIIWGLALLIGVIGLLCWMTNDAGIRGLGVGLVLFACGLAFGGSVITQLWAIGARFELFITFQPEPTNKNSERLK